MAKSYQVKADISAKDKFSVVLGKLGGAVGKFGKTVGEELKSTGKQLAWTGAALVAAGYAAKKAGEFLFGFAKEATDAGSALADLQSQTGIGAAKIQTFAYAFKKGGVSAEDFASALTTMSKNVGQLIAGKGKLKGLLDAVAPAGFAKQLKQAKPEERLDLLVSAMMAITDESKRAAFAQAAFGEAGAKLAGTSAEGFAKAAKQARELGLIMSDEDVAAADEFGDRLEDLEDGWGALKRKFGSALAAGLLPMLKDALTWLKANKDEAGRWASELGTSVANAVVAVKNGFVWIYDHREEILSWAKTLAVAIGTIKVAGLIGDLTKATGMVGTLGASVAGLGIAIDLLGHKFDSTANEDTRKTKLKASLVGLPKDFVPEKQSFGAATPFFGIAKMLGGGDPNQEFDRRRAVVNGLVETKWAAQQIAAQYSSPAIAAATANDVHQAVLARPADPMLPSNWGSPLEIVLKVDDPGGILAKPEVKKAPPGTKPKVQHNRGTRTTEHMP